MFHKNVAFSVLLYFCKWLVLFVPRWPIFYVLLYRSFKIQNVVVNLDLFIWKIIDINLAERILIRLKTGLYSYLQSIKDDDGWCKYYTENSEFEKTERDVHPDEDWKISLEVLL